MNINCIICADSFVSADSIVAAGSCGHCFHFHCLIQWLDTSKTCPQCRSKCTERTIIKIFLNINTNLDSTEDAGQLIKKVNNLNFKLKEKETKVASLEDKVEKEKLALTKCAKTVSILENKLKSLESLNYAYNEENRILKAKNKKLKQQLEIMESVGNVISVTTAEVEDLVKTETNPKILGALCDMVTSVKKELKDANDKNELLKELMESMQSQHLDYCKEMEAKKKQKCTELESEIYRLKQRLAKVIDRTFVNLPEGTDNNENKTVFTPDVNRKRKYSYLEPRSLEPQPLRSQTEQFTILKKPKLGVNTTMQPVLSSDAAFTELSDLKNATQPKSSDGLHHCFAALTIKSANKPQNKSVF